MGKFKSFKQFINESTKSPQNVVIKYSEKYSDDANFFEKFLETFPSNKLFREELLETIKDYYVETYDSDDEFHMPEDEELWDDYWYPELEMEMIEQFVGLIPISDSWVDFHNDLLESGW